jgi:hypothetical protein
LQSLAAAFGVKDVEIKPMLLKDAVLLANVGSKSFSNAALTTHRQFELILGERAGCSREQAY